MFFNELKNLYDFDQAQDLILFNKKEILVEGTPLFLRDWFNKGILSIQDLLDDADNTLSYQEFNNKYSCKSNFLQYYQVISAIPKDLLNNAKLSDPIRKELYSTENFTIQLNESTQLVLNNAKTSDFYKLLNEKTHTAEHTGPRRWNENLSMHMNEDSRKKAFTSLKNLCKEIKLREFQFTLIHRITVTKIELCRFGITPDDDCLYCGEKDSIDHSFKDCRFVIPFDTEVIKVSVYPK